MQTKLTLRIDKDLIERAKKHAETTGTSVSQLVAGFFAALDMDETEGPDELPPITRSIRGILAGCGVDKEDYGRYLEAKHQ